MNKRKNDLIENNTFRDQVIVNFQAYLKHLNQIFHYKQHKVLQVIEDLLYHRDHLNNNEPSREYVHVRVMYQDLFQ